MSSIPNYTRFAHEAMGSFFELLVADVESDYARQAAEAVFREIDRLEKILSRFDPGSEIARLSRLVPEENLRIGLETLECLRLAASVYKETGGAFDITVSPPVAGFINTADTEQAAENDETCPHRNSAMDRLVLSDESKPGGPVAFSIHIQGKEPALLDLGGIGKGYALDRVTEILNDWDISAALIHGGTSTALATGAPQGEPGWATGVGGPWAEEAGMEEFALRGRALSGSGTEVKGGHILDPRTGEPAVGHMAAWALHPSAAVADALSTAFMVMGTEEVKAFCHKHPEASALVICFSESGRGEPHLFGNWSSEIQ